MKYSTLLALIGVVTSTSDTQKLINKERGVTLYEHADFNNNPPGVGWQDKFGPGAHTGDFPNDVVTSYQILKGCCVTFFEHYDYKGQSFAECGPKKSNVPDGWNDYISSMKVSCIENKGESDEFEDNGTGDKMIDQETISKLDDLRDVYLKESVARGKAIHDAMKAGSFKPGKKPTGSLPFDDKIYYRSEHENDWLDGFDVEIWQEVPGYILFVIMWIYFFYPPIQDIVLMSFYLLYDSGSSIELEQYAEEHETGWLYWAIAQGVLSIGTIAFYIYMIIAEYTMDVDVYSDMGHVIAFMVLNAVNFLLPVSKYIIIYYEGELGYKDEYPYDMDCGIFDCLFALNKPIGNLNVEIEMIPDIIKTSTLFSNFAVFLIVPWVNEWMLGTYDGFV